MAVEFRDLRWAIVVSQHQSLRQAAEALTIRQSTLSRRLRDLEDSLGAVLFERTNGGTRPTAVGREFLGIAHRIVDESDAAFHRLKARCKGENGQLSIGVHTSFAAGNLRATLGDYRRRFPDVDIRTVDGQRNNLLGDLSIGSVDVIIMNTARGVWNDRTMSLWSERVIIALPERHRLSANAVIRWSDLRNERLLLPERDPGSEFERLLTAKLVGPDSAHILFQDVSLDRLLSLVSAECGSLLVLEGATGAHYDGVVYREVHDDDGPTRVNFAAYWRQANTNPTLQPFLEMLRERYPDLAVPPSGD